MTTAQHFPTKEWSLEEAVEQFIGEEFSDGDLVSHDWLRWALDINQREMRENEFVLLERVEALKSALLIDHRIALQNVRGKGYRVVPPAEQARYAAEEMSRHVAKGLKKADTLLHYTRMDSMSIDDRRRHTDTEVRMSALAGMVGKGKRDVFSLFKPQ